MVEDIMYDSKLSNDVITVSSLYLPPSIESVLLVEENNDSNINPEEEFREELKFSSQILVLVKLICRINDQAEVLVNQNFLKTNQF